METGVEQVQGVHQLERNRDSLSEQAMEKGEGNKSKTSDEMVKKRTISVHATGEAVCPPDVLDFLISVNSSKETIEAAQLSVRRRTEYILQVLRNSGIKEGSIKCSSEISRSESVTFQTDILVECDSLTQCEPARNLLMEKMDTSVYFGPIGYHHSSEGKEGKRQEAFKIAVTNAKGKAQCIAQAVGVRLGSALEVNEISQDSDTGTGREVWDSDSARLSLHQRYINATINYTSQVQITFEAQPLRTCSHKKCHKH